MKSATNVNFDKDVLESLRNHLEKINHGKRGPNKISQSKFINDAVARALKAK